MPSTSSTRSYISSLRMLRPPLVESQPRAPYIDSLLVAFDDVCISRDCRVGILTRIAASPALAQEVPALVERDADLFEPPSVVVACSPIRLPVPELVLLGDEVLYRSVDLRIVHQPSQKVSQRRRLGTPRRGELLVVPIGEIGPSTVRALEEREQGCPRVNGGSKAPSSPRPRSFRSPAR